ncbi:MAG: hypothetical protein Q7J47_03450 [Azoarcus sp.]|nr:hypothetical protein [Azoarcus sp.]
MIFKLVVFLVILLVIAVLGVRGYRNAVKRFEAERIGPDEALPGCSPKPESPHCHKPTP